MHVLSVDIIEDLVLYKRTDGTDDEDGRGAAFKEKKTRQKIDLLSTSPSKKRKKGSS